jgi:RNA polymerase sigma-70 factor (ECF subfamily)
MAAFIAPEPAPDRLLAERERNELVRWALMQLPETYRTVLVLRHYQDLKFREIADVLEVPEGTVKSRMAEALKQIGLLLKPKLADVPAEKSAKPQAKQNQPEESLML